MAKKTAKADRPVGEMRAGELRSKLESLEAEANELKAERNAGIHSGSITVREERKLAAEIERLALEAHEVRDQLNRELGVFGRKGIDRFPDPNTGTAAWPKPGED